MFEEVLREVCAKVHGMRAALLVDRDGMVVASARDGNGAASLDMVAAAFMDLARRAAKAGEDVEMGLAEELLVGGPSGSVLYRAVAPDYGLLGVLGPEGLPGRARFELRRAGAKLRPELEV
jgi:predicted regulator of Ras-like GTPase activity (Roadblock/LC7/MglB family)